MKLVYSPEAIDDIQQTKQYIGKVLKNRKAAQRVANMILRSCKQLKSFPNSGNDLSAKIDCTADLRYIICENWLVFYQINGDEVQIIRVLDGRTDYVRILFD